MRFLKKAWTWRPTRIVLRFVVATSALGSATVQAETMYISRNASFVDREHVRMKVVQECAPQKMIPKSIREEILDSFVLEGANLTDTPFGDAHHLTMALSIVELDLPPGSGWSDRPRRLRINAVLRRNGSVVAEVPGDAYARGSGNFIQKVFRIRKSCDYVEYLVNAASRSVVGRIRLMKLLPIVEREPK